MIAFNDPQNPRPKIGYYDELETYVHNLGFNVPAGSPGYIPASQKLTADIADGITLALRNFYRTKSNSYDEIEMMMDMCFYVHYKRTINMFVIALDFTSHFGSQFTVMSVAEYKPDVYPNGTFAYDWEQKQIRKELERKRRA